MNFVYLRTPIGSDVFVEKYLEEKLIRLQKEISMFSEMTYLIECFTLLCSCASTNKVSHLKRTIPPAQLKIFLTGFVRKLRKAFEKLSGHDLNEMQWVTCQLPAKYGGFSLRSGMLTAGAQHVMSLQKCAAQMQCHTRGLNLRECAKQTSRIMAERMHLIRVRY